MWTREVEMAVTRLQSPLHARQRESKVDRGDPLLFCFMPISKNWATHEAQSNTFPIPASHGSPQLHLPLLNPPIHSFLLFSSASPQPFTHTQVYLSTSLFLVQSPLLVSLTPLLCVSISSISGPLFHFGATTPSTIESSKQQWEWWRKLVVFVSTYSLSLTLSLSSSICLVAEKMFEAIVVVVIIRWNRLCFQLSRRMTRLRSPSPILGCRLWSVWVINYFSFMFMAWFFVPYWEMYIAVTLGRFPKRI